MKVAQNSIQIELHGPDFKVVKEFYGKLGFHIEWEWKPNGEKGYLVIRKGDNILCFWPGNESVRDQSYFKNFPSNTQRGFGVEIAIIDDNIDDLYKNAKTFAKIVDPLQVQPWGLKDFRIEDPFGFYLKFTEPHNILEYHDVLKKNNS